MKNNNLSLEQLRNLIFEGLSINELDVVDTVAKPETGIDANVDTDVDTDNEEETFSNNNNIAALDAKYGELLKDVPEVKERADKEVAYVLETGRCHLTTTMATNKKAKSYELFNYVTSKLAALYNNYHLDYNLALNKLQEKGNQEYITFYQLFVGEHKSMKEIARIMNKKTGREVRNKLKIPTFRILEGNEQLNIRKGLMQAFSPVSDGNPTVIFNVIANELNLFTTLGSYRSKGAGTGESKKDMTDILLDGFYSGFDKALQGYKLEKGSFYSLLLTAAKNDIKRLFMRVDGGNRVATQSSSMDNPLDDSDGGSGTFADTVIDSDDENQTNDSRFTHAADAQMDKITNKLDKGKKQTEREILYHAVVDYVKNVLESGRSKVAWDIFNLLFIQQIPPAEAIKKLNISRSFLDKKVTDIKKLINAKMEDFKQHLGQELGKDVAFPDDKFNPTVNSIAQKKVKAKLREELMAIMGPLVLEVCAAKLRKIDEAEASINRIAGLLKESYDNVNISEDNSEIGTQDLYSNVKKFVETTIDSLNKLGVELHHITDIAQEIKTDYPAISQQMEGTVYDMVDTLFQYPHRLQKMLDMIHHLYNRNANRLN